MLVLRWSGRTTGQLGYKNCTETYFRESHPIQLRWPCKNSCNGDFLYHLDSNQVSCLTHCIVHAKMFLSQNPSNVSCFKVCSICKYLGSKLHQKQLKCHKIFGYQQKPFQWMIAVVGLYVLYIAIYQFWNQDQTNTCNRIADTTCWAWERGILIGSGEDVRVYLMNRLLAWCFSHQLKRVTTIAVSIKPWTIKLVSILLPSTIFLVKKFHWMLQPSITIYFTVIVTDPEIIMDCNGLTVFALHCMQIIYC